MIPLLAIARYPKPPPTVVADTTPPTFTTISITPSAITETKLTAVTLSVRYEDTE